MKSKSDEEKAGYVRGIFAAISRNYDFINRLMTFGMDMSWRRFLLSVADVPLSGRLLDVGTGTGDIALEALRMDPWIRVTGLDFTAEMMEAGRRRKDADAIDWCRGDALCMPFPDKIYDAVVSGFLLRNVVDVRSALMEQVRVVKPGGRVVCLDTSPVPRNILRPIIHLYLRIVIPLLGRLLTGKGDAYNYLASSTINFLEPEVLGNIMREAGLEDVHFRRFMFGNIAVHWGVRPALHADAGSVKI
ncbi:MAG: ubiquinone/menaquinone biosynthesis methyltransferase [Deltaproteobacteria bacterium]|nr:ubiquinone/menaquinone biosynthesis methyltransferase [Deltaproteobacteria bacterium]